MKTFISNIEGKELTHYMGVWANYDNCTGSGLIEEICPEVFATDEDGKTRTLSPEGTWIIGKNLCSLVVVPPHLEAKVLEAADEDVEDIVNPVLVLVDSQGQIQYVCDDPQGNSFIPIDEFRSLD